VSDFPTLKDINTFNLWHAVNQQLVKTAVADSHAPRTLFDQPGRNVAGTSATGILLLKMSEIVIVCDAKSEA
jgi:hypothetical protein